MRPSSSTVFTAIMILLLTACGSEPEEQTETTTEPTTQAEQTTAATDKKPEGSEDQKATEAPATEEFNTPIVLGNDPTSIGDLLTATNPKQRQEQVKKDIRGDSNRVNPFGAPLVKPPPPKDSPLIPGSQEAKEKAVDQATKNLNPRQVPELPALPLLALAPPPRSIPPDPPGVVPTKPPGGNGVDVPTTSNPQDTGTGGRTVSPVPRTDDRREIAKNNPNGTRGSGGGGDSKAAESSKTRSKPRVPTLTPSGVSRVPNLPEKLGPEKLPSTRNRQAVAQIPTVTPRNRPAVAQIPTLTPRGVPGVPELPQKIGPEKLPPTPNDQPIAQIPNTALTPRGIPGAPELPEKIGPDQLPPAPVAQVPSSPPIPPPPDTQLADGIEVTGVIDVGSQVQIIAKAPNEPTSRYIKVGQKIANGEVVVKRVEEEAGEPVVILEQNGVEVSKMVGQKVAIATDE